MSELSEEEIIKRLKDTISLFNGETHCFTHSDNERVEAIQGLLDLYQKEKQKNKELENADLTTIYMNGFYDGEKKWKDKIKQRINEIDNTGIKTFNEQINMELKRIDNQRIEDLQELLEERN